jgi:hypothetical protein
MAAQFYIQKNEKREGTYKDFCLYLATLLKNTDEDDVSSFNETCQA